MKHYDASKKYYRLLSDDYDAIKGQIYGEGDRLDYDSEFYVKQLIVDWPEDWEEVKLVDGVWVEAKPKTYTLEEIEKALDKVLALEVSYEAFKELKGDFSWDKAINLVESIKTHLKQ
jgi:hypothetical protein